MTHQRFILLLIGPVVLIAGCYYATWSISAGEDDFAPTGSLTETSDHRLADGIAIGDSNDANHLAGACALEGERWRASLGEAFHVLVRPPYVIGGDLSESELESCYRETILSTEYALNASFFDRSPENPIIVLLLSNDAVYAKVSRYFDGQHRDCYAGYYLRRERRVVVNISTGNGTLAHELTHALAHADAPRLPEWFDEGLASLYEQSEFSHDGLRLLGLPNWRIHFIRQAWRTGKLPSLQETIGRGAIDTRHEGLNYALVRYFCLFLQERNLLEPYYRKLRKSTEADPTGEETLEKIFRVKSMNEIEIQFHEWLKNQHVERTTKSIDAASPS